MFTELSGRSEQLDTVAGDTAALRFCASRCAGTAAFEGSAEQGRGLRACC